MKLIKGLKNSGQMLFVILTSFMFFLLRLPSLFEPLWYGDEGIYQVLGTSIGYGKLLYKEIFDNKPPLLYWLYSIFHSDQFTVKLVSLIFGILSVLIFYFLAKKLFNGSGKASRIATFTFAIMFALPLFEGNIANAENFMLLPIITAAYLVVNHKKFLIAGFLLGIAFLFKIVAIFDLCAFLAFYLIVNLGSIKKEIKITKLLIGFFAPIVAMTLYFIFNDAVFDFIKATFLSNISYVGYGNRTGSVPGLLFVKSFVLAAFTIYLFLKRRTINQNSLFILIWLAFSLFNAFFSQRPYTHYLLTLIPSFSLLIGLLLHERKHRKFAIISILIVLIVVFKGFGLPNVARSIGYYQNFISFLSGQKTLIAYQRFFDRNTPFDYEIARFIRPKLSKNDTIFVWGNNAQLYELVRVIAPTKYIAAYHITGYKDGLSTTKEAIERVKPKYIVVMRNSIIPLALTDYSLKININNSSIYERVF